MTTMGDVALWIVLGVIAIWVIAQSVQRKKK
jgi:hypothetical protein